MPSDVGRNRSSRHEVCRLHRAGIAVARILTDLLEEAVLPHVAEITSPTSDAAKWASSAITPTLDIGSTRRMSSIQTSVSVAVLDPTLVEDAGCELLYRGEVGRTDIGIPDVNQVGPLHST